jgi:hypothetical protein
MAAVDGRHLDNSNGRLVVEGSLDEGGLEFQLNGMTMEPNTPTEVLVDTEYVASIVATGDTFFRGALIRLEGVDGNFDFEEEENSQIASVCSPPVVGVTHTDNDEKTILSGRVTFDATGDATFDVTAVFSNNADESVYYYTGFSLTVVEEFTDGSNAEPPTESPVGNEIDDTTVSPGDGPTTRIPTASPLAQPATPTAPTPVPPTPLPEPPTSDACYYAGSTTLATLSLLIAAWLL